MLLKVAIKSLGYRASTAWLAILSIAVSLVLLLSVEHIQSQVKSSFSKTVSGTDLIVGARTGSTNLLMYSVFRIGNATNNIRWDSYKKIANNPKVAWTIPISLGDSHRGYRVMATNTDFFLHYHYGNKRPLEMATGREFEAPTEVVLGADVAASLHYKLGDSLVLSHGMANTSFSQHKNHPFTVVGILEKTGTPVDQTLHISLEAMDLIHQGFQGAPTQQVKAKTNQAGDKQEYAPKYITAFMLGLKSRIDTFAVQADINNETSEPLLAILPGVELSLLWRTLGWFESTLYGISVLVFISAMLGLVMMLLVSMRERRKEIATLRSIGASPWFIFALIQAETLVIIVVAAALAFTFTQLILIYASTQLTQILGLSIEATLASARVAYLLAISVLVALVVGVIPSLAAYRASLHAGLNSGD